MKELNKATLQRMYFVKKMTLKEIGDFYDISHSAVAKKMDNFNLKRRNASEANYILHNKSECFRVNNRKNQLLRNAGLMLYWCEGTKRDKIGRNNRTLAFTNTNMEMLKIWIRFLLDICSVSLGKIRVRVYVHMNQNGEHLKRYWSRKLNIPLKNFENISYTKKTTVNREYKGTVKIKVHNIKLFAIIQQMICKLTRELLV